MTPELAAILTDVRSLLRSIQYLFGSLPDRFRAAHLEGRITSLLARLDRAIPHTPEPMEEDGLA